MKVLTIIQPWASLIALGEKKIETRSWRPKYRGPILIHAGKSVDKGALKIFSFVLMHHHVDNLPSGAIIAKANIVDCVEIGLGTDPINRIAYLKNGEKVTGNEFGFGDYSPFRFAWMLDNIEPLKEPIPAKGKLSLWEFDCKGSGLNESNTI
jgi:hypothetical protein